MGQAEPRQGPILITGGTGFLGGHVVAALRARKLPIVIAPRSASCDLRRSDAVSGLFAAVRPAVIVHLAARAGGIVANLAAPADFFHDNLVMGAHVIDRARSTGARLVLIGTTCSYPADAPLPLCEDDLWSGLPDASNAPYGIAKRTLIAMADAYRKQHGLEVTTLLPANLYGPGDRFDRELGHVIPGMIFAMERARRSAQSSVTLWGDGSPTREFLYAGDCAEAIALAVERGVAADAGPMNLGSGQEISMRDLAARVATAVGYAGEIVWDPSRPGGQPRRLLDSTRARARLGFAPQISLEVGLGKTIAAYRAALATENP